MNTDCANRKVPVQERPVTISNVQLFRMVVWVQVLLLQADSVQQRAACRGACEFLQGRVRAIVRAAIVHCIYIVGGNKIS